MIYFKDLLNPTCKGITLTISTFRRLQSIYPFVRLKQLHTTIHLTVLDCLGGVQEDKYVLVDITKSVASTKILEEIEISRAVFEVYEGGVVRCFIIIQFWQ